MSDTEELTRLMRHMAGLADRANAGLQKNVVESAAGMSANVRTSVVQAVAALTACSATLMLVAGMTEPEGIAQLRRLLGDLDNDTDYTAWADEHVEPLMLQGELRAVAAFLRYRLAQERRAIKLEAAPDG